jgi:tetratricopeptide (TPR) repeat protein
MLEAAIEIDRRYGLKERISSSLSLAPQDVETEVGRALVDDAIRKVTQIDVRDQFRVRAPWTVVLPLVPAICVFVLVMFVPDAVKDKTSQANAAAPKPNIVKKRVDKLHEQIQKKREELKKEGLTEAEQLMKELEKGVDELRNKNNVDQKKVLIKLNDLAKVIEEKRQQLAGSDEMRKQMEQLKDLQKGPADEIAKAMKEGNFDKAIEELQKLVDKISKGELSEQEKKDLANQLSELQKKLEEAKQAYDEAKKQLDQQIKDKMSKGDLAGANELQKQLDKLNSMAPQMNQLQKMGQQCKECSQALQNGDSAQAAQKLSELAENLQQMENQLEQLESLDEMLDQLSDAKGDMGDMQSDSQMGQMAQMGEGQSQMEDGIPGYGLNEGKGRGERPEEKTDTASYDSQAQSKINKGKAVMIGHADGPNIKGQTREEAKEAILNSTPEKSDPLTDAQLPRDQKDHTREYFEKYQDGSDSEDSKDSQVDKDDDRLE